MNKEQLKHTELAVKAWRAWVKDKPFQSEDMANGFIEGFNFCLNSKTADYDKLKKENKELKEELKNYEDLATVAYMQGADNQKKKYVEQLTKAKELLEKLILEVKGHEEINGYDTCEPVQEAEQFLKDLEK